MPTSSQSDPPETPGPSRAEHDPYAALRVPSFCLFLAGNFLFVIAYQMHTVAVGYEIYQRTNSTMALGFVGLVEFLPLLILGLIAGQTADRFDRRKVLTCCVALVALSSATMAFCSYFHLPIWTFYVCLTTIGVGRAFQGPAKASLLPQLVPISSFNNAVTWSAGTFHLASVVGPSTGGFLIWALGRTYYVYLIDACLGAAFIALLTFVRHRAHQRETAAPSFKSLLAGLRFIQSRPVILGSITLDMFAVLLGGATTLLPVFAKDILHVNAGGLGCLRAAVAVGALSMSFILAYRPPMARAGRALLLSVVGFGITTIIFGLSQSFILSLAMLFLIGALDNISVVIRQTLVQILTPEQMRGRVAAVNTIFIGASNELGGFESGLVAAAFGPVFSVVSGGIGTLFVVAGVAWLWPTLARYGRLDTPPDVEPLEEVADDLSTAGEAAGVIATAAQPARELPAAH